ncbi:MULTISPECIES: hypothetical protein [Actinomadura]|uniref:hypothetical protein n=1 Tax=Actinomadura TaxID=1988 RepID=UPI000401D82F|nr:MULTISPECIES: hypothetical protein [Actinomadura]RSN43796.1 hypothetical protein DMH08_37705 [Actinomadura sp. WAC 06369]
MPIKVRRTARRAWRRVARAYLHACARDDAAGRGFQVPSGVWVCERCEHAVLELAAFREHLRVVHSL